MIFFFILHIATQIIPDFQVNCEDYPSASPQLFPAVALYDSGGIAVWYDMRMPANGMRVFGVLLDVFGDTIGGNFRISDDTTTGCLFNPDVSCDCQGNFTTVWVQHSNTMCRRFYTNGIPLGPAFAVNNVQTSCFSPSVDVDSAGRTVIAWSDNREGLYRIYCQIYDEIGNPVGTNIPVSDSLQYMSMSCDLSFSNNKGYIVVWQYNYDIWCQRFDSLGNRIGENFQIWDDTLNIDENHPAIECAQNGTFMATWSTHIRCDVFCRLFDSAASPITDVITLNEPSLTQSWRPKVTNVNDSLWFCVWDDSPLNIYMQRISATGTLIGTNMQINEPLGTQNRNPCIGAINENIFIAWTRRLAMFGYDICAQRVSSEGTLIGQTFVITDDKGGSPQYRPKVVVDTTGDFFIVWDDYRNLASGFPDQYGRRFDLQGNPYVDDFQVNTYNDATNSSIALNELGLYVTVWARTYPDSTRQIYGQRFDRNGMALGPNFQISLASGNTGLDFPKIASLSNNYFVVVWDEYRFNYLYVYGRLLDPIGIPFGNEFIACIDSTAHTREGGIVDEGNSRFILGMSCDKESIGVAIQEFDYEAHALSPPVVLNEIPTTYVILSGAKGINRYLFVWADFEGDINIYGQFLDDSLQKIGNNFLVSDDTVNYKGNPSVVSNNRGEFFVVWDDGRSGYGDIYGQFFDSTGMKIGDNFRVDNDTTNSPQWLPACYSENNLIYIVWADARNPAHWFDIYCKVIEWLQPFVSENKETHIQNFIILSPNPFRNEINIRYRPAPLRGRRPEITDNSVIELRIYDISGSLVKDFSRQSSVLAHRLSVKWDGKDNNGNLLPAGVYFVRLTTQSSHEIKKVVQIK
ncbi:MAG: T9SS type A sorting domain-containing protein [candidate division WOR-3 bacterium]|nr:MAG: T9SS type A sorting domain-containing protein [candidate division WOR-3 bacterium]